MPKYASCCAMCEPPPPRPTTPIVHSEKMLDASAPKNDWRLNRVSMQPSKEFHRRTYKRYPDSLAIGPSGAPHRPSCRIETQYERPMNPVRTHVYKTRH